MRKFVVYAGLAFLCLVFSCNNAVQEEVRLKGVSIFSQYQNVSSDTCNFALKDCDNIKASDVKVHFTDGTSQAVKMNPRFVLLKKNEEVPFNITNVDEAKIKFTIRISVKLLETENVLHGGDLRIWVPISSSDKNEAKEAIPDNVHVNDYTFEVAYNFEESDLPQIWILYKKEPTARVKSDDLRFDSKADGNEPLLLYHSFPNQGKTLTIPLYLDTSEGPKVYNLHVKTSVAPQNQNANIQSIKFNKIDGIIEGKNIICPSSFPVNSTISVVPTLENPQASYSVNSGENVIIKAEGVSFTIVVTPEKIDGIRKTYFVFLEAPPNNEIRKVKALNYSNELTELPNVTDLLDVGNIEKEGEEKYISIPLYTAGENVALNFEATIEIASIFFMKKNRWTRLDSYSSSKNILTLREGILPLLPSLSNKIKLKVLFKNNTYDTITVKFKKSKYLEKINVVGFYINDEEISNSDISTYFDGSLPTFTAKGPKIFVDIVSKEALSASIEGKTYKSVYSGFLSYGLSLPIDMPSVNEIKNIDVSIECDYAESLHLQFKVKRLEGAVDLVLYPSINGHTLGGDILEKIIKGENPVLSVSGELMSFAVDTKDDVIKSMKVNDEMSVKKTLIDSLTGEEFFRFEFLIKLPNIDEVKDIELKIEPQNLAEYNNINWRFRVERKF